MYLQYINSTVGADPPYESQPTSYDYDAPLSEAGDITNKFLAVRKTISQYLPVPQVPIPANSTKLALGKVPLSYVSYFFFSKSNLNIDQIN